MAKQNTGTGATYVAAHSMDLSLARALALGAADVNQAIRKYVGETLAANRNNIAQVHRKGLQELVDRGAISGKESETLTKVFKLIVDVDRDRADAEDAFLEIRGRYQEMVIDQRSSPAALAIMGVASASFSLDKNSPLKVNKTAGAMGAIAGAATGAGIGFGIGGPLGGAIGGLIGGAVGGTVGLCG